jgi:hypothetical protein
MSEEACKHVTVKRLQSKQCGWPVTKDGYCTYHHPDSIARRKKEQEEALARHERRKLEQEAAKFPLTVENAVMFLLEMGYRIDRPPPEEKTPATRAGV